MRTSCPWPHNMTGVYCIRNISTGSFYIGSSATDITRRWSFHVRFLNKGTHHNYRLQADWRLYGAPIFNFSVLEECPSNKCIELEQWFIDIFDPTYNVARIAGAPFLGRHHTPEELAKMSAAMKGRKFSPEHRAKISAAKKGRPNPHRGYHHTQESRDRCASSLRPYHERSHILPH